MFRSRNPGVWKQVECRRNVLGVIAATHWTKKKQCNPLSGLNIGCLWVSLNSQRAEITSWRSAFAINSVQLLLWFRVQGRHASSMTKSELAKSFFRKSQWSTRILDFGSSTWKKCLFHPKKESTKVFLSLPPTLFLHCPAGTWEEKCQVLWFLPIMSTRRNVFKTQRLRPVLLTEGLLLALGIRRPTQPRQKTKSTNRKEVNGYQSQRRKNSS